MPPAPPFTSPHSQQQLPALYLYPLNDTFVPKHIALVGNQRVKIGRQTNAKTVPAERNGYFDSKVLSRQHAEIWEDGAKIYIKDVKSSNGTFINGERLSPEGVESEPFELKNDDVVEFGIDIIGEDNKTTIHHKVAARVMCVFTEEDVQAAARFEQMQNNSNHSALSAQQSGIAGGSQFSFGQGQAAPQPAQRRPTLQSQALGVMGGMGGSVRPPGKSGLSFDHILSRLQGELLKSRETGAELHSITTTMNELQDTLGGSLPPSLPPLPHNLPPVRPPQPPTSNEAGQSSESGTIPVPALNELRSELHETQASLASHVDKVRALEDMLAEHEAIKSDIATLRELMDERKREFELLRHEGAHQANEQHDELRSGRYRGEDDDTSSIHTVVPRELERVDEEDEDQIMNEEEDDEDRRRRREELGRPRTPEPTGMGMDDEESPNTKRRHRPSGTPNRDAESVVLDELAERLSALSGRIDSAVEFNNSLQAQHAATQTTISLLQSKIATLEEMVQATQSQLLQQNAAQEAAQAEILKAVQEPPRDAERESLTAMLNEWKKGVEGQWSAVQEEWSQERERLNKAREEWEDRAKTLEMGFDAKVNASVASIIAVQRHHSYLPNGDIKLNGGAGLVTPPSPVSVASNPGRSKSRRRRSSSSRGRSRSPSPVSSIEMIEGVSSADLGNHSNPGSRRTSDRYTRDRSLSPSIPDDSSEPESSRKHAAPGTQYLITPDPSVKDSPGRQSSNSVSADSGAESSMPKSDHNLRLATGILVLGIATAAVIWRVRQE
ncbi:hypothetical protein PISMIDRAFT_677021 [Pisolithus microcarpus 441]|uniref:FHA domain-containing protein n=1 Tax=Pisolithus microcarpus 441 TaxID=765257 RepID=A0A0C9YL15_9AGAM|nr:hypothetical protein BKA83DRAFT_677021 [Pisolithus microcarpus]KIK25705.1 hypothetical protein PISMIDRAFT_677021 [Pisolithus microcarpus 441]